GRVGELCDEVVSGLDDLIDVDVEGLPHLRATGGSREEVSEGLGAGELTSVRQGGRDLENEILAQHRQDAAAVAVPEQLGDGVGHLGLRVSLPAAGGLRGYVERLGGRNVGAGHA